MGRFLPFVILFIILIGFGAFLFMSQNSSSNNTLVLPTVTPTNELTSLDAASPTAIPSAFQQSASSSPTQNQQKTASKATIKTSKGDIVLTLYPTDAPNTVANFAKKAKDGFYKNLTFHRVEDWVIQGGDPLGTGTGGGQMPSELNKKPFAVGSLGIARGGNIQISNDAQFFIVKQDASWLNEQYTNFGIVTSGIDVVNKIAIGDKILSVTVE